MAGWATGYQIYRELSGDAAHTVFPTGVLPSLTIGGVLNAIYHYLVATYSTAAQS